MSFGFRVATVKNSPNQAWFQTKVKGGSVLYAPLVFGSVRIDDVAPDRQHGGMRPITFMLGLNSQKMGAKWN